jgi:hypothetical protein
MAGKAIVQLKLQPSLTGVSAATDTLTSAAHGLTLGRQLLYVSGTGFTGLTAGIIYYVVTVATDTFKVSATSGGGAITVGTSSAGVFQPVHAMEAQLLTAKNEQEEKTIMAPDASGILRKVRTVLVKQAEDFPFDILEVKRLLDIFGGTLAGRKIGTATIWIPDPDDATGAIALKSETDFACTVTRSTDVAFGQSDASKTTINIESNKAGMVTWTADGAP